MMRYKVWRSELLELENEECINEGEDCVYMLEEAPALARIRELESDIEECQTYRCQQKDLNNSQVRRIAELEAEVKTLKHIIVVDNEKDLLGIRISALENALREVRRCGHQPARGIIDKALGDTWEKETGYTSDRGENSGGSEHGK
jgi:hypothetical protein